MDNSDNDERIMEDIIARGGNTVQPTRTRSVARQIGSSTETWSVMETSLLRTLKITRMTYIAADSKNNEDLEDANAEGSNKVYISCIKFISNNSITHFLHK
jgi:hypothetical protein